MATVNHDTLETINMHVPGYVQPTNPGAVGAGILWMDTSGGASNWVAKLRNVTNEDWEVFGVSGLSGYSGISGYSGLSGFSGYSSISGYSGYSGISGYSSISGYSGYSSISGYSGFSGVGGSHNQTFTDGDLSAGVLTVTHSLSNKINIVQVFDDSDSLVIPDGVVMSSTSQCTIDLSSYGTLSGTWAVMVVN